MIIYSIYQKTSTQIKVNTPSNILCVLKISQESISWWLFVKCIDFFCMGDEYTESELRYKHSKQTCTENDFQETNILQSFLVA